MCVSVCRPWACQCRGSWKSEASHWEQVGDARALSLRFLSFFLRQLVISSSRSTRADSVDNYRFCMVAMFTMTWTRIICFLSVCQDTFACRINACCNIHHLQDCFTQCPSSSSNNRVRTSCGYSPESAPKTHPVLHEDGTSSPRAEGPRKTGSSVQELAAAPRVPQGFPHGHHTLRNGAPRLSLAADAQPNHSSHGCRHISFHEMCAMCLMWCTILVFVVFFRSRSVCE